VRREGKRETKNERERLRTNGRERERESERERRDATVRGNREISLLERCLFRRKKRHLSLKETSKRDIYL